MLIINFQNSNATSIISTMLNELERHINSLHNYQKRYNNLNIESIEKFNKYNGCLKKFFVKNVQTLHINGCLIMMI